MFKIKKIYGNFYRGDYLVVKKMYINSLLFTTTKRSVKLLKVVAVALLITESPF